MNENDNIKIEDISEIRAHIIMGLSLLLPIIMYIVIRSIFRNVLNLEHTPIAPMLILLLAVLLVVIYMHVVDYRNMKMVCENTEKLLGAVLVFQPIYFVFRQEVLGRPKKGALIYAVVSTVEILSVIIIYAIACIRDMLELL